MKNSDKLKNIHPKFKASIFKDGMNQLKIGGIIYSIICILYTLIEMLDEFDMENYYSYTISNTDFGYAFPYIIIYGTIFTIIFIVLASLAMTNFLRSGKARDFYCSTPNSILTIWMGFALAVFTWTAIGILASYIVQLPFMLISDVKMIGMWFKMLLTMLSFAFLFCGIVMLAINLTGRAISAIVTICGIVLLPTILWFTVNFSFIAFLGQLNFIPYFEIKAFPESISTFLYYGMYDLYVSTSSEIIDSLCSTSTIICNLVLGVIYLAVAVVFASIRTGDAVGKPFVNKAAHFISLMVLSIDVTGFITCFAVGRLSDLILYNEYYTIKSDIALIVIFCLISIAVMYWVCELLLTFDVKRSYRTLKFMPIPFVIAIALVGGGYLGFNAQFSYAPSASDVESFTLVRNDILDNNLAVFRMANTYGRLITDETEFKDEEVINYTVEQINTFVNTFDNNLSNAIEKYFNFGEIDNNYINIKLNLKNGKSITRTIRYDDTFSQKLADAITSDSDFMSKFLELPDKEYTNISFSVDGLSKDDTLKIYESFKTEYNAMSNKKKLAYLKQETTGIGYYDEDMYYSELYDDYIRYVDDGTEEVAGYEENVSYTDIQLNYNVKAPGEYLVSSSYYYPNETLDEAMSIVMSVSGYNNSKFYDSSAYFEQAYTITPSAFPKTMQLIVELCNSKISNFTEIASKLNNNTILFSISAEYYNGKDVIYVSYDYVNETDFEFLSPEFLNQTGNYDESEIYYDEDTDKYVKYVDIDDVNQLVNQLFEDAANSTEIDMSKPLARINVSFADDEIQYYTFFIQTESPIDILNIED